MRFLRAATKSQSRRLRFESLLLLVIRTLILVLVAVALAEPYLESAGWIPEAPSNVHRLIVIDASLSMEYESEGRAVSERAREAARALVAEAQPGDSFQIVTIAREGGVLVRQPAFDTAEVLAEIDQLTWTEEFGAPRRALEMVQQLLKESSPPRPDQVHVTIISDFQRSNWWPDSQSERPALRQSLNELSQAAELSIVNVGPEDPANAAITNLHVDPALATVGAPVSIQATIQGQSGTVQNLAVELVENNSILQTKTVEVPAGAEASVTFTVLSRDPGSRRLEVRLPPDGLNADNHRWVAVDVREELSVLLVNGRESGESLGQATDFVEVALAPRFPAESSDHQEIPGVVGFRPVVVNEAEFARAEMAEYDCIILCDVPFLSETESAQLDRFVRSGGGLIIGLGDQIRPDVYNQWSSSAGQSLLPMQLVRIAGEQDQSSEPTHFAEPTSRHPIVEPFLGNPQAGLTTANVYRYYQTRFWEETTERAESLDGAIGSEHRFVDDLRDDDDSSLSARISPARVAVGFESGDAAIIEREYGAGRILLVTTSLDERWGSWALWPSFLPMVHRMVRHAVSTRAERSWMVGDRLHQEYPLQTVGLPVTVQLPDGRRAPGRSTLEDGTTTVTFSRTPQSGIYRFVLGPPVNETELFAVNVDARESDLRTLSEDELTSTLLAGIDVQLMSPGDRQSEPRVAEASQGFLTRWLLFVVLILLMVEQIMAWSPRHGLMALATAPLMVAGFLLFPTATLCLLLAGLGTLLLRRFGRLPVPR